MDISDLQAYDAELQSDLEACFPAVIKFGAGPELTCAGGTLRETDARFIIGGEVNEFSVVFRVRKSLLATPPALGTRFQWKRVGDPDWQQLNTALMKLGNPRAGIAHTLYGGNPAQ